ncbi:MAG: hypothetical protein MHM6MM_007563 [Cercozoa sp. M6MM]
MSQVYIHLLSPTDRKEERDQNADPRNWPLGPPSTLRAEQMIALHSEPRVAASMSPVFMPFY